MGKDNRKMRWEIFKQAGKLALANTSENLAGRMENRPGWVEFCIGYIRDYPVRPSTQKKKFPSLLSFGISCVLYQGFDGTNVIFHTALTLTCYINEVFVLTKTPYISPSWVSFGVFIVRILQKIQRVVIALYWWSFFFTNHYSRTPGEKKALLKNRRSNPTVENKVDQGWAFDRSFLQKIMRFIRNIENSLLLFTTEFKNYAVINKWLGHENWWD